jgi:hypothetical protein
MDASTWDTACPVFDFNGDEQTEDSDFVTWRAVLSGL